MTFAHFEWDEQNIEHIARHGVEADEAEAVLDLKPLILRASGKRYLAYGQTDEGRYLLVVFVRKPENLIRVITARDLSDAEKQNYRRRKQGTMTKPPNIPVFSTEQEAADGYAAHDTAPFMDRLEEVQEPIPVQRTHPRKKPIGLRIRSDYLEKIKQVAARKGIPYQTLIQMWLVEKLDQEGPELPGR